MFNPDGINYIGHIELDSKYKTFGILPEDRRKHTYIIGKSGMGKSTLLENMILQDIFAGKGVCFMDPLGDCAESILDQIPAFRQKDVIYFNPADTEFPIGLNMLETKSGEPNFLIASSLMAVLSRIWAGTWSARMEYILNNTILALLETPGNTLLGVIKMLTDKNFRSGIVANVKNVMVKNFWQQEFATFNERYKQESISPILNKVGQFFASPMMRNILGQPVSSIDFRQIMDGQKILIVNLAKGRIGEDNSNLLGSLIVTRFQLAAMSRTDMLEKDRKDFYLYVDEFQNFTNHSFASILSEARKYRLCLTIAHQYIAQMDETDNQVVRNAVFGNVGTIISFRIGADDAEFMEKELPPVLKTAFLNLDRGQIIIKFPVLNKSLNPIVAYTLPPIYHQIKGKKLAMIESSRARYTRPRAQIEAEIENYFNKNQITQNGGETIIATKKKRIRKRPDAKSEVVK